MFQGRALLLTVDCTAATNLVAGTLKKVNFFIRKLAQVYRLNFVSMFSAVTK